MRSWFGLVALIFLTFHAVSSANIIIWTEGGSPGDKVWRANLDGTGIAPFINYGNSGNEIAVNIQSGKIYWVGANFSHGIIFEADLDGTGAREFVHGPKSWHLSAVTLDPTMGKLFWSLRRSSELTGSIWQAGLVMPDGESAQTRTDIQQVINEGLSSPLVLKMVPGSGFIYVRDGVIGQGAEHELAIRRVAIDGSSVTTVVPNRVHDFDIDQVQGKFYWSDYTPGGSSVRRANVDGTNEETLFTFSNPREIHVDGVAGILYWTRATQDPELWRANLDGTGAELLFQINEDFADFVILTCMTSVCGNGCCDQGETCQTCPSECNVCGDGCCLGHESTCNCPADCTVPVCGDDCCHDLEDCNNCAIDCTPGCGDNCCLGFESTCGCTADCGSLCGDGCCNAGETYSNCLADCDEPSCGTCRLWGDIAPPFCTVNLDDILCWLRAFGDYSLCPLCDITPCSGNGICNLDDLLAVLAAFGGGNSCPAPCPSGGCCMGSGQCMSLSKDDCLSAGGDYQGTRWPCGTATCP